jgi:pimeloyl-ACP methyl ester carboxylesterase
LDRFEINKHLTEIKLLIMKKINLIAIILLIGITVSFSSAGQESNFTGKTIKIESTDGIQVYADIYDTNVQEDYPVILLFHQAGYSRGEYRPIAPMLNELGYICISIDQRSGSSVNEILNETNAQAKEKGLSTKYVDALPDLRATIDYALKNYKNKKVILWGSSYSSSLVFILGTEYKENVKALLSFSPGEYFTYKDKEIKDYAQMIECPVFITSSGSEKKDWESIYEAIKGKKSFYLPEDKGKHGSKALWETSEGHGKYWDAVKNFLKEIQ